MNEIKNWIDYHKMIDKELERIKNIEDTYVYKLQKKLEQSEKKREKALEYAKRITWSDGCIDCEPEQTKKLYKLLR